jgi:hypothetical protein
MTAVRTTIDLDDDTAAAIDRLRRDEGLGLSEAANRLMRRGLTRRDVGERFVQPTRPVGIRVDVSNVADALDVLEGTDRR